MYHIKDDQRAIRSSEMLYDGLAKLMRQQPFHTITVTDLVKVAQVGRTTFYRNFDEIEDILRLRCDQVFDGLLTYLIEYTQKHRQDARTILVRPLLHYFDTHSEIIELLMLAKRLDMIHASFHRILQPFKMQLAKRLAVDETILEYGLVIRTGIATNILLHWIATGKKQSPDELAENLGVMIAHMITLEQLL